MRTAFKRIGLFAKHNSRSIQDTFERLVKFLDKRGHSLTLEEESASLLSKHSFPTASRETIGSVSDLVIVVGGDGSLLNAARAIVAFGVPILGINRGSLGFLADILPADMEKDLDAILSGHYNQEKRALLQAKIKRSNEIVAEGTALNDVVLHSGNVSRMIAFEVYINDQFVLRSQADGLITATPTGSTAYALSAGGPIVYPTLNALLLVPMLPHTLSNRPIVVEGHSRIELVLNENSGIIPKLSCDAQMQFELHSHDIIQIEKCKDELTLIHPLHHDYFDVLRQKLGWSTMQMKS